MQVVPLPHKANTLPLPSSCHVTAVVLGCAQTKTVPNDLGSVFSNAVTPSAVGRLECWLQELQQQQGFVQLESKSSVSVHLLHPGTRTSHGLSFINYEG